MVEFYTENCIFIELKQITDIIIPLFKLHALFLYLATEKINSSNSFPCAFFKAFDIFRELPLVKILWEKNPVQFSS